MRLAFGSDRTGSETLQANERIKHFAGSVTAWGNALVIAAFGKLALIGFDAFVILWLIVGGGLIWAASQSLTMLEKEKKDE